MLENGAKTDIADEEGNTPLHCAATRGTVEVAKFLMSLGADPYARNNEELVPYEVVTREEIRNEFAVCPVTGKPGTIVCKFCHVIWYFSVD